MPFGLVTAKRRAHRRDVDWSRASGVRVNSVFAPHLDGVWLPHLNYWRNLVKPEWPALPGTDNGTFAANATQFTQTRPATGNLFPPQTFNDLTNYGIWSVRGALSAGDSVADFSQFSTRGFTFLGGVTRQRTGTQFSTGYLWCLGGIQSSTATRNYALAINNGGVWSPAIHSGSSKGTLGGGTPSSSEIGQTRVLGQVGSPWGSNSQYFFDNYNAETKGRSTLTGSHGSAMVNPTTGFFAFGARHGGTASTKGWEWKSTLCSIHPIFLWSRALIEIDSATGALRDRSEYDAVSSGDLHDVIEFSKARVYSFATGNPAGAAAVDFHNVVSAFVGLHPVQGVLAASMQGVEMSGAGNHTVLGTVAGNIHNISGSLTGSTILSGVISADLQNVQTSAAGEVTTTGILSGNVHHTESSAAGGSAVSGVLDVSIHNISAAINKAASVWKRLLRYMSHWQRAWRGFRRY